MAHSNVCREMSLNIAAAAAAVRSFTMFLLLIDCERQLVMSHVHNSHCTYDHYLHIVIMSYNNNCVALPFYIGLSAVQVEEDMVERF